MVRRRNPVQALQEAVQVQPQAGPAGGPETTAAPINLPVFDFQAISGTLSAFVAEKARKRNAELEQEGEAYGAQHEAILTHLEEGTAGKSPKEAERWVDEQFNLLVEKGILPPLAHPKRQIGRTRAVSRAMVRKYQGRLRARLNDMTATRDANGDPVEAPDVEGVIAEEWGKIANSPAIRNFYGSQEALPYKERADAEFRTTVFERRSAAEQQDYETEFQNEVGGFFDGILDAHPVVTGETLAGITEHVSREVQEHYVQQPRALVFEALKSAILRRTAIDPQDGLRAAYAAHDLVIGDVRLGDDNSGIGLKLQELTRQVREREAQDGITELQAEQNRRRLAIQQAEAEYMPLLVRAKQDGQSVAALAAQLSERYLREDQADARFGGRGAFVVDAMNETARAMDGARQSDQALLDDFHRLLALGQLDDAELLVDGALRSGSLTGEDFAEARRLLADRRNVSRLVEDSNLFRTVANRYAELKPQGLAAEVQQQVDDRVQDLRLQMERDYVEVVQKTGREDRVWLDTRWQADQERIRAIEKEFRGDKNTVEVGIRQRLVRHQDAAELIEDGLRRGALTADEAQSWRERNVAAAAGRERLVNSPAMAEAEQALARRMEGEDPALFEAALRDLRDRYAGAVDDLLANPAVDPRSFQSRADAEARRVGRELEEQLFPTVQETDSGRTVEVSPGAAQRGLGAGKTAEEIQTSADVLNADLQQADHLYAVVADPATRERLTDKHPFFDSVRHPDLPRDLYRYAAAWWSGMDPVFGSPVQREDVETRARKALAAVPAERQQEAALSVAALVGIDAPAVLRERFELSMPEGDQAAVRREIELLTGPYAYLPLGLRDSQVAALQALLEPAVVDMTGASYRPLTTPFFRSGEALEAFQRDPAWPEFLRRVGIDPDDQAQVNLFLESQVKNIDRVNPGA